MTDRYTQAAEYFVQTLSCQPKHLGVTDTPIWRAWFVNAMRDRFAEHDKAVDQLCFEANLIICSIEAWEDAVRKIVQTDPKHGMRLEGLKAALAAVSETW